MRLLSTKCFEKKFSHKVDEEVFAIKPLHWKTSVCTSSTHDIASIENSKICEEYDLVETLNDYYVNIVEMSCRIKSYLFASFSSANNDENVI